MPVIMLSGKCQICLLITMCQTFHWMITHQSSKGLSRIKHDQVLVENVIRLQLYQLTSFMSDLCRCWCSKQTGHLC